jgi:flagellin
MIATAAASTSDFGEDYQATATYADGNQSVFDQGTGLSMVDSAGNTIVLEDADLTTANGSLTVGTLDVNDALFQIGANEGQTVSVTIDNVGPATLAVSSGTQFGSLLSLASADVVAELDAGATANFSGGALKQGDADALADAIRLIDTAIDEISTTRGKLGAIQADNLQVQLDSLRVAYENLQAAESTIRDTDMSLDMSQFTKYQIMLQAGTAMLAQANQIPSSILKLLQ